MKLKTLLIITAIFSIINGISAMIMPEKVGSLFGIESCPSALMAAQLAGLGSTAIALFSWFMRNIEDIKTQHALTLSLLIVNGIGIGLSVMGIISGTMNTGWPAVAYFIILTIAYFYFHFLHPKKVR
jgi:hypothetical protein